MADKGYEGANAYLPSVLPKKDTNITSDEKRENHRIGSNRVIVENFYGRLKTLCGAARLTIKNDLNLYNDIIDICVALTSHHVSLRPLRANEIFSIRTSTTSLANSSSLSNGNCCTLLRVRDHLL